ncbi:Aspartate kinase [Prochlorococcus marinus subsp. pastoris str. CCMP1986]|uniref:aspartate kinase n=1 Tax=Prochlorococcus marinus subsp. pastoris (strain CCMP1986 / NIES-2087 / MED4) TaxID=59919 RepID=Q7UZL4_PROMP|nr:aspartate kinase [Prochlorococcus marinus]KGF86895.1 Aspartokinase [Prochlorococcus marinus str. EQPAC1]CAE20107.1 Aspartate kinase [Prochlorococcus marinus subsp. pastoris str. CCMP1986]
MALLIKKFGGTSVEDITKIKAIAQSIIQSKEAGNDIVVVVSAMGHSTDHLNKLAESISKNPNSRELDMLLSTGEQVTMALLSMSLNEYGIPAISLTGSQVGIVTESIHGKARILDIKTERIQNYINQGYVVVVAGFQGSTLSHTGSMEITTLGRGGSDTSAVALSTALGAETCEIYTDVPGVLTTDPRIVPNAKLLDIISCEEMLELASVGASVLHPRAVEIARNYGIKLYVKSSQALSNGTLLHSKIKPLALKRGGLELTKTVNSLEVLEKQTVFSISKLPDRPGIAAQIFETLSKANINVDLIIQATHDGKSNDIAFTVNDFELTKTIDQCKLITKQLGGEYDFKKNMTKLSIQGAGIMGRPSVSADLFDTLFQANINVRLIATSEIKVSCVIDIENISKAIRFVSEKFKLSDKQIFINPVIESEDQPEVRGIALDKNQVQVSIRNLPDKPGVAASICLALAENNLIFDTIVQSERLTSLKTKDISFTMSKQDRERANTIFHSLTKKLAGSFIEDGPAIAKVSTVGAGMAFKVGTAGKIFRALANKNINIEMIATSEIRTSCIVLEQDCDQAVNAIHSYFQLDK